MKNNKFHYTNFFDKTEILESLFSRTQYPWEALSLIESFIDDFENKFQDLGYTKLREGVYFGKNVEIDPTAKIQDKAIIGHNSIIGHAAYVRANCLIGDNVNVGHATEVKHSIILNEAKLAHLNYIGDSIVGNDCNISGGATLANWRFDKKIVTVKDGNNRIETGTDKFGSIIGDHSFIGAGAVINPGTVLSKETIVFPLVSVSGSHLTPSTIK